MEFYTSSPYILCQGPYVSHYFAVYQPSSNALSLTYGGTQLWLMVSSQQGPAMLTLCQEPESFVDCACLIQVLAFVSIDMGNKAMQSCSSDA